MTQRRVTWRRWLKGVALLAVLAMLAGCGKKSSAPALPPEVVQAWQKAGATVGWHHVDDHGELNFGSGPRGNPGDVPAFLFPQWKEGLLLKLPAPAGPFGLALTAPQVTDTSLKELAGFKNLQVLNLSRTKVTDAGLKQLAGLESLQSLGLEFTPVTDVGLKELAALKNLQSLDLCNTKVTDAGLKELGRLKNLQRLNLLQTDITDTGVKELTALKNLRGLNLSNTNVTDASLKELAGLKSLQRLDLPRTVTDAAVNDLKKALPGCSISN